MGNKKATGFLCLRLVPCFAYVGAEDNRKGIPFVKIVSLLCKLIQFLMVALSVTVHKALILLVFLNHPYQSLAFPRIFLHCVALGFIVSGLLLSVGSEVQILSGTPGSTAASLFSGLAAFFYSSFSR